MMPSLKDLNLTKAQQAKFDALYEAHQECLKAGIQFVSFDDSMYPFNGKKLADVSPSGIVPITDPSKQFKISTMPSWDSINIDEPYCQAEITFTLK